MEALSPDLTSVLALETSLARHIKAGVVGWLRAEGLSLDDEQWHSGLCRTLARFGICGETSRRPPRMAVFDWSRTETCSAEGLALCTVLARRLAPTGVQLLAGEAALDDVNEVLTRTGVRTMAEITHWAPCPCAGRGTARALTSARWSDGIEDSMSEFCDELNESLTGLGASKRCRKSIVGTTIDLVQNVRSHSGATHAAAAALLFPRRRPKVVQVGIADDGVGIPGAILAQPLHHWLAWFPDASLTEAVLHHGLSGRESQTGGGMAALVQRLLRETTAKVIVRTGGALLSFGSNAPTRFSKRNLNPGVGTQVRLEIGLE